MLNEIPQPAPEIVLGRVGHYFQPNSSDGEELAGSCQKADVVYVHSPTTVNLSVNSHDGTQFGRTSIPVKAAAIGGASFHLNRDCPWGR